MEFVNPKYQLQEKNIFNIRQKEFDEIESNILQMLKPIEELGFTVKDFGIKEPRYTGGNLSRTIKQNLVLKLEKNESEIDLSLVIPKLINDNYIIINGRKKIPQFQLFDIPVVTRGKNIKIRTNVANIVIYEEERRTPYIKATVLGRKVPLSTLMFAYYTRKDLDNMFDLSSLKDKVLPTGTIFEKFIFDLVELYKESSEKTQDDHIKELGVYYSKFNSKSKGEDVIYGLDIMLKIDVLSSKFFESDSVLEELIKVLEKGEIDDLDYRNKRVRCLEYMVLNKVAKALFDLCISNRTTKQPKFNINSTQILSECNVSNIVQFDFSINPIQELTMLSRLSLTGPGGFDKQNVPEHLRDITPSMLGRVCPVDTPDRENCGVLQNLLPNVNLDENLKFNDNILSDQPTSIPVSMVPFLEHDDQTRLQMSSSQMRQAIMLQNFDLPLIQSGCEGLYTDQTQFLKKAKRDGEVLYVDSNYIIVSYDNKETDIFDVSYRKIYVGNLDLFKVYVKQGDKFKAGDILAESNFCEDGKITIGKNLLTAVMIHYGYNYEDGIVISDRLVNDGSLTSFHYVDLSFNIPIDKVILSLEDENYNPLPKVGDHIKIGEVYAKLKEIPSGNQSDFYSIFEESIPLIAKQNTIITEVNIYVNEWNTNIPEYNDWVKKKIESQRKEEEQFHGVLFEHFEDDVAKKLIKERSLDKFSSTGKYKMKGEPVNGIHIEMFGIHFRSIKVGDKIGNRHGNKGVISNIVPHEKMPKLEDGRHVDICINPLGIISRMNIGQLFELHMAMSLNDLKINCKEMLKSGKSQAEIKKYILSYINVIDNSNDNWFFKQFTEQMQTEIDEKFIDELFIVQPPFESSNIEMVKNALKYTGTNFNYKVTDPISGKDILNPIAVGYMYFFRMVHIAESRLAARGIASYAKRTLQPLAGRKNRGGQRCGEMETACLIAHEATLNLHDFQTTKSDCIDLKNKYIREMIETDLVKEEKEIDNVSESVKLLDSYLIVSGIDKD